MHQMMRSLGHHGVMTRKGAAAFLVVLLLGAVACGGDSPTASEEAAEDRAEQAETGGGSEEEGQNKGPRGAKGTAEGGEGADDGTRVSGRGAAGGAGGQGSEDDSSSAWYPANGVYTYGQSGWEEFCDTSGCERQDLPPTQDVKTTHKSRSNDVVVVVTEAEASDSRFVRTTTRHTRNGAFVTDVYLKFDYEGVSFNNSYQPDPPVETLRLPLRSGMAWSGRWEDKTSGDYRIRIGPQEQLSVGGRSVQALRVETTTHFRGEFEGTAEVTIWIDPATLAPVKTQGRLDVDSFFGAYRSAFKATLRSAPGYR